MVLCLVEALESFDRLSTGLLRSAADALSCLAATMDLKNEFRAVPVETLSCTDFSEPSVLLDQPHVCVLFKPAQWVVTVVSNRYSGWMAHDATEGGDLLLQRWVSQRLGPCFSIAADVAAQHGIVHRLDRGTSGPVLCAKSYTGYYSARLQFAARNVRKEYLCLCIGVLPTWPQFLQASLRADSRQSRWQIDVPMPGGRHASTQVCNVGHFLSPAGEICSLVEVRLHTGRRHQIRAHLRYEGHPLVGDEVYGYGGEPWCQGIFLHSHLLTFNTGDGPASVSVPLRASLQSALAHLVALDSHSMGMLAKWWSRPASVG